VSSCLPLVEGHSLRVCELAVEIASSEGGLVRLPNSDSAFSKSTGAAREASGSTVSSGGSLGPVS
jgi:hypothetical protein